MESKFSRRSFLQASAVAAVSVAMSACGATPTPTSVSATATKAAVAAPTAAPAAPTAVPTRAAVEIVITKSESAAAPILQDAPAHLAQTQATGVKLNFQTVPQADYDAKVKLWMSTKQLPDLTQVSYTIMRDYANPGTLQPVLPLIDKYGPNLKKYLAVYPRVIEKLKMNGELYAIPCTSYNDKLMAPMPCIRKDLLDKIGMPLPDDFDKLYTVLKELKKANPSAAGWTTRNGIKRLLMLVAYPFGSGLGGWSRGIDVPYYEETVGKGTWLYGPIHPEFKDVLAYLAKLYKEQLLDPDIANTPMDMWTQKNGSGKGLFTWDNFSFCVGWNQAVRGVDPKATWTPFPIVKGAKGARQNDYSGFPVSTAAWCISANCKYPDRVIQLLDWKLSPVGLDISCWGIENTHYTLKGTRPSSIEDYSLAGVEKAMDKTQRSVLPDVWQKYSKKTDPFRSYQSDTGTGQLDFVVMWDNAIIYSWDAPGEGDAWYSMSTSDKGLHPEVRVPSFSADENAKLKQVLTAVNAIIDPAIDKVVLGQATLSDFDKAVQDIIKAGAQDLEKIYNDAEARSL